MTCTAADAEGDQFPVTEDGYAGYEYQNIMNQVEDASLDECYEDTGGNASCYLEGCTPNY